MKKKYVNNLLNGKEVIGTEVSVEDGKLVVEVEFEDEFDPKFGDIVRVNCKYRGTRRNYMICIMPDKQVPNDDEVDYFDIANIDKGCKVSFDCGFNDGDYIIPASESEKKELFDKLAKVGKKWNQNTKELEDIRWTPKKGDKYFFIDCFGIIQCTINLAAVDSFRIETNNCFKTKEAAQPYADKFKEILKNSKAE